MNEEEIIEKYHHFKIKTADGIELDLIETKYYKELLALYKQEKEKTPESVRKQFETYQDRICELEEKLKIATAMLTKGTYPEENEGDNDFDKKFIVINKMEELNKKFIAVDKIKEKIEELEKEQKEYEDSQEWEIQDDIYAKIIVLEELLEEK